MNYVCEKNKCAGCMACAEVCPVGAIEIVDSVNAFNAVIDQAKCIKCNLCRRTCQANGAPQLKEPIYWAQGWSKDPATRKKSTSGGFATELMRAFVNDGGMVCSCRFSDGGFSFEFTDDIAEIDNFSGSKYVKSNPFGIYKKISQLIREGRKVMFVGLPCQSASLLKYVGDNENLYTVDLICHGTPSPKVLDSFLKSYDLKAGEAGKIAFRSYDGYVVSVDDRTFSSPGIYDYYSLYFLRGYLFTENCYSCSYASEKRVSDITVGDAWGSELPLEERKQGISFALCQSEKGKELLEKANVNLMDIELEAVKQANPQLRHPVSMPEKRNSIINDIISGKDYRKVVKKNTPDKYYKTEVKLFLKKTGLK